MKNFLKKIRNPKVVQRIIVVVMVVLITAGFLFYQKTNGRVQVDDSQVLAPIISLYPSASGHLMQLSAVEGHTVKTGDSLAVVGSDTIRSQSDGIITSAQDQVGGIVTPQTPLIQMVNPNDLRVVGTIDENKGLSDIKVGQVVSFSVDAFPGETFWGYVDEVSPTAKSQQAAFTISSERPVQQFQIYTRFDAKSYPQIKNGMSAKLTIFTKN
ncbi:MAG: HlyD family secretion protein [Candidatus Levyibacteriota bacterium]